jgi:hypothetical protein
MRRLLLGGAVRRLRLLASTGTVTAVAAFSSAGADEQAYVPSTTALAVPLPVVGEDEAHPHVEGVLALLRQDWLRWLLAVSGAVADALLGLLLPRALSNVMGSSVVWTDYAELAALRLVFALR